MTDRATFAKPTGTPGYAHYGGVLQTEWDKRLWGSRGPKAYREMAESSATVGAALYAFESLVKATGYRIEPADETPDAEELATFVEECLDDMDGAFSDTISDVLSCRPYGFSLLWPVYKVRNGPTDDRVTDSKYDDGRVGWRAWSPRAQETIVRWEIIDETGEAVAAIQQAPPSYREARLPLRDTLHFRVRGRNGSPEGLSVLRTAYEAYYYLKNIMRIEAIGIERDLAGLPVVWVPIEVQGDAALRAPWDDLGVNIRRDEQASVTMPLVIDPETKMKMYDLTLLTSGGQRQIDTEPVIARYERLILRSLLTDWLSMGDTGVGSYGQSVNRTDIFLQSVKGELQGIEEVINQQAVRRLLKLNGLSLDLCPRFVFNEVARQDIKQMADILAALIPQGVVDPSEPDLRQWIYDFFGWPMATVTDEQVQAETTGTTPAGTPTTTTTPPPETPTVTTTPAPARKTAFAEGDEGEVEITDEDLDEMMGWVRENVPGVADVLDAKVEGAKE